MNDIKITGRLVNDPIVKYTPTGKIVCQFTLAVSRPYKNAEGNRDADFIPVVLWEKAAETAGNNLSKGKKILITGRIQNRSYVSKDGIKRWITEIISNHFEYMFSQPTGNNNFGEKFGTDEPIAFNEEIPF